MKACKDCKWFRNGLVGGECWSPRNGPNHVTGGLTERHPEYNRKSDSGFYGANACGPDGRWFEPKPWSPWQRFLGRVLGVSP
jgi:hypothetical protein